MANFLILHGIENHRPPQHWQFLLAAALVERGHSVSYPALPSPDAPDLDVWIERLDSELAELGDTTVVCHSLACALWLHAATRGTTTSAARLLLVAPPAAERIPESGARFRLASLDADLVRASVRGEVVLACSDADPYDPAGVERDRVAAAFDVRPTVFPGAGHFTPDSGYGSWRWALDWCVGDRRG